VTRYLPSGAQALTAAGLAPGAAITHDGITFTWPGVPPGQPDNVVAQGQTILVSGSGTTLGVLGAASAAKPGGGKGTGTVYYTDGSTSSFTITLDSYSGTPGAGNSAIATLPYVNHSDPVTTGGAGRGTVPAGGGQISGMHIFAPGVGPLSWQGVPLSGNDS
jgi:hypothetical protein